MYRPVVLADVEGELADGLRKAFLDAHRAANR